MTDDRPIVKCTFKGCPCIGRWGDGGRCPLHRGTGFEPARRPSLAEQWEIDTEGQR